ncbi:response regulator [Olivibacter sp. LS-1]|uniref:hybrid sensor histidine kinase/response regulator transcription factor n=1 Tax=Olivibacter sp. LS-1 TaxID=2592345 RepID=UPI0011EB87E2|nr:hybrid sensor histidine kinase/response regulator transcription factor [Olivibacter sp. LS-1]QEL03153.1 response regulator [Olivibacter sp. LS-1]
MQTVQLYQRISWYALFILFFYCMIGNPYYLKAKDGLHFQHINHFQGLSNNTVECIFQDARGFMWFGTRDGLNRYDGYEVISYRNIPNNPHSLSDNYITCIYEDKTGGLWIGTLNGLNYYDRAKNQFKRFKSSDNREYAISCNRISAITEVGGALWIGTFGGGLNRLDKRTGHFITYRQVAHKASLVDDFIRCFYVDQKQRLWIGTQRGLSLLEPKKGIFCQIPHDKGLDILAIVEDANHQILLGTNNEGVYSFNTQLLRYEERRYHEGINGGITSDLIRALLLDQQRRLWVGSINGGLSQYNPQTEEWSHYTAEPDNPNSLSQRTISALFEDRQGNLWIGTHRGGVNLYSPHAKKFELFRRTAHRESLGYNDVTAFCEDSKGRIWVGTDGGGLDLFNPKTKKFTHYRHDPKNSQSLASNAVLHIMEDRNGRLWVSTWGGGIHLFNPEKGTFKRYLHDENNRASITSNFVHEIFEDARGQFWVATYYGGLNRFDPEKGTFSRFTYGNNLQNVFKGNNVVAIEEDKHGQLWFGTDDGGLNCYQPESGRIIHYLDNWEKNPYVRIIHEDRKGRLWLGLDKLYLFDENKKQFLPNPASSDLSQGYIKGILEDEQGNLWLSTTNGLVKYHPENQNYRRYNMNDGLQDLEFEAGAYLKTREGSFLFGGINGFNRFVPDKLAENRVKPPLYFTSFELFNKKVEVGEKGSPLPVDISVVDRISLRHQQSSFSVTFSALNYIASANNQYAYKLEGFDSDWIRTNDRKAVYTNLNPGKYILRVKASNNDGVWNENEKKLFIEIKPPFWATWWFRACGLAFLAVLLFQYIRITREKHRQRLEDQKKEELHQLQLQFFTNISHEFRTPLSLILGPIENLLHEEKSAGKKLQVYQLIHRNAKRLMGLINELMDFRQVETGGFKLNVRAGDMSEHVRRIAEDFTLIAKQNQITFTVQLPDDDDLTWFDPTMLDKIMLNILNNAFKYTRTEGNIHVKLLKSINEHHPAYPHQLRIPPIYPAKAYRYFVVKDNGIGISESSLQHLFKRYYRIADYHIGSGVGLAFVKSLTLLHKGYIEVSSETDQGVEFMVAIPCDREDYQEHEINHQAAASSTDIVIQTTSAVQNKKKSKRPIRTAEEKAPHILLVEDHDELRSFIKDQLGSSYQIWEATNGIEALDFLQERLPDLIISDVMMPKMNGVQLCKRLKSNPETQSIPFLILTAKQDEDAHLAGVEAGADYYFSKPLNMAFLQQTIRNIFMQRASIKRRLAKNSQLVALEKAHRQKDRAFTQKIVKIIENNLSNPALDITFLCKETGMSRTKLYQEIKMIHNQSIGDFIRSIRMKQAAHLMVYDNLPIAEVMFRVGIQTQSYFTKAFKNEFGKTPTQYLKDLEKK